MYTGKIYICSKVQKEVRSRPAESLWVKIKGKNNRGDVMVGSTLDHLFRQKR